MLPGTQFHKDIMLAWFLHHLRSDDRAKLMAELPAAYNDVLACNAVRVVPTEPVPLYDHRVAGLLLSPSAKPLSS